jgi:hypothetical protein
MNFKNIEIISTLQFFEIEIAKLKKLLEEKAEPEKTIDYIVNWADAPEWALAHAYDETGEGYWYGPHHNSASKRFDSYINSGYQIAEVVMEIHRKNWKNSMTEKPLNF